MTKKREFIPNHVHGSRNGYENYGCRCAECVAAHSAYTLALYHRNREAARTAARLSQKGGA